MKTHPLIPLVFALSALILPTALSAAEFSVTAPRYTEPVVPTASPAVRDLHAVSPRSAGTPATQAVIPKAGPAQAAAANATPPPLLNFDGISSVDNPIELIPPDTNGAIGRNHYVQITNVSFAVYDKAGRQVKPPTPIEALWEGAPGYCSGGPLGPGADRRVIDPIVLYDHFDDRWVITHASDAYAWCIAVSQTADPLGSYYLYEYDFVAEKWWPDFQKFAVWMDGYYASTPAGPAGSNFAAVAFDRNNMLKGQPARRIDFSWKSETEFTRVLMPADVDGPIAPKGEPEYFYIFQNAYTSPSDPSSRVELYTFKADFDRPDQSAFALAAKIPISAFKPCEKIGAGHCSVAQPDPGQGLDFDEAPAFRLAFRKLGNEYALVGNFSIYNLANLGQAGIRWFELRKAANNVPPTWRLQQEGDWMPDGHSRFMGSIAQDSAGNIALGYTATSSTLKPAVRYAARLASDPPGTLQPEVSLVDGGGVQITNTRWGDYSRMAVDPSDDCTFWYTNEYYKENSDVGWSTRIGAFKLPSCVPIARYLNVAVTGQGTVKSEPAGIDCGTQCSAGFAGNTAVTLTATPADGRSFAGWGGACAGTAPTCPLAITEDRAVTAKFVASPPTVNLTASPSSIDFMGASTVTWASTGADSCRATASDGWSGNMPLSGSRVVSLAASVTYTLTCVGSGGSASASVTVTVAADPYECLFNWAEGHYAGLLSPTGGFSRLLSPYLYRYYPNTRAYLGVSSADRHVYYLGPDGVLQDMGDVSGWLATAKCVP